MPYKLGCAGNAMEEYDSSTGRYGSGNNSRFGNASASTRPLTDYLFANEGSESSIVLTMPNYKRAITPEEKFLNYSLNPSNPNNNGKAEAYQKALCYNKNNFKGLRDQIHNAVSSGRVKPYQIKFSEHGIKYCFEIPVRGTNGKTKPVIVVYQIDKGQTAPRMITNYVKGK
jgi:hypothetical protein